MVRGLGASGVAVVLLAACSSAAPQPPPHAGTVVVHAVFASGPGGPGGSPTHGPIAHARVGLRATGGAEKADMTDDRGDAKFVVAAGVYVARLTDGKGGKLDCGGGSDSLTVKVTRDATARVALACWGAG